MSGKLSRSRPRPRMEQEQQQQQFDDPNVSIIRAVQDERPFPYGLRSRVRAAQRQREDAVEAPAKRKQTGKIRRVNEKEFDQLTLGDVSAGTDQTEQERMLKEQLRRNKKRRQAAEGNAVRMVRRIDNLIDGGAGWKAVQAYLRQLSTKDTDQFADAALLARQYMQDRAADDRSAFSNPQVRKMALTIIKSITGSNPNKKKRVYWGSKVVPPGESTRAVVKGQKNLSQNRKAQVDAKVYDPKYFKLMNPAVPGSVGGLTGNAVPLYPAWYNKITKSTQQRYDRNMNQEQIMEQMTDQNDPYMLNVAKLGEKSATWDPNANQWTGELVNKRVQKLTNLSANTIEHFNTSMALLAKPMSRAEIDNQVPAIVTKIVNANTHLSTASFGPLKQGGSGLFAGRWIDPVSGNMRMLPRASDKFLNPLSKQQRLSYIQARILNHWNSLQLAELQYNKVLAQNYKQKQSRKIKNMLNAPQNTGTFNRMISKNIQSYFTQPPNKSAKYLIMNRIGPQRLVAIYQMTDVQSVARTDVGPDDERQNIRRIEKWNQQVAEALGELSDEAAQQLTQLSATKQKMRLQQAAYNMTMYARKQFQTGLIKAMKAAIIPNNIPAKDAIDLQQNVISWQQAIQSRIGVGGVRKASSFAPMIQQWQSVKEAPVTIQQGLARFGALSDFVRANSQNLGINNGPGLLKTIQQKSSPGEVQQWRQKAIQAENQIWSTSNVQKAKKRLAIK